MEKIIYQYITENLSNIKDILVGAGVVVGLAGLFGCSAFYKIRRLCNLSEIASGKRSVEDAR